MTKIKGRLWIVAAPSGGGKTSLVEAAVAKMDKVVRSVSYTTREQRVGELNGKDYVFVDNTEFEQLIAENAMLEYEKVFNHYYGTSLPFIDKHLKQGKDVILTIDWQGARSVRQKVPESKGIFILPPRLEVLQQRLQNRGQDSQQVIEQRMAQAKAQASHYDEFDYLIINDCFEKALDDLISILTADRLCRPRQTEQQAELIQKLLNE